MEHNLDDSLNLESAMRVDFEQPEETVCHQSDIILDQEDIPMEFVYEEKPMLMDTGNEEIIISDLIGGQFNLQDLQNDQSDLSGMNEVEPSYNLTSQSDTMLDLQLNQQIISSSQAQLQQNIITVQTSPRKKLETMIPRPVPIAPKPTMVNKIYGKPLNIAPKPVTLVPNKNIVNKPRQTVSFQGNTKGNTILAQIGKQLIMMPASTQKIKLVATSQANVSSLQKIVRSDSNQVQILPAKNTISSQGKPMKIITLQGQSDAKPVITKLLPAGQAHAQRYVSLPSHKTVPLTVGKKVIMTSPSKQTVKLTKKHEIISLKPVTKLMQKADVILKTTAPPTQVSKVETVEPTRTQIHQINVPGKGIQYIRLVTNSGTAPTKAVLKQPQKIITVPSKSLVMADNKAVVTKAPKLVRIAPMKTTQTITPAPVRSSQSLLAPISAEPEPKTKEIEEIDSPYAQGDTEVDSKDALRALIENTMGDDAGVNHEVTMDYKKQLYSEENTMDSTGLAEGEEPSEEHPLIVIPSNFEHTVEVQSDYNKSNESQSMNMSVLKEENDSMNAYDENSYSYVEQGVETSELGLRPRKACNCTKSQCLKLYCDCFANGEFCNQCNCNNCYNNLQNEELRQKAIRGCLDRNPHAFKPKIGKSKIGGPEIVRRHNKGCNCKRSGCLKNYCECYEARIACTAMCKCVGCRNVTDCMEQGRLERVARPPLAPRPLAAGHGHGHGHGHAKQPCTFMTTDVIEAVCQCLVAAAEGGERLRGRGEGGADVSEGEGADPVRDVIEEFSRCLQDIIAAAHSTPLPQEESPA